MSEILTREVMGVFALGVLWLNTLLVAAAAVARARELARRRAALHPLDLDRPGAYGVVRATSGSEGLAVLAIEQVGRHAAGKRRAILWHDRAHASTVRGGTVAVEGREAPIRVAAATGPGAEAWVDPAALAEAARCPGAAAFDAAYPDARKARGVTRSIKAEVGADGGAWVAGVLRREGDELVLAPGDDASRPLVVSAVDPRAWLAGRVAMLLAFVPAVILGAGAVTALALWPPVFDGVVSKVGGLACFVYFLLVLPAGTRARDAATLPPHRLLRGRWEADGA